MSIEPHSLRVRPLRQDDDAGAPRPESLHRLGLVGAQREGPGPVRPGPGRILAQGDGVGLAVDVAG